MSGRSMNVRDLVFATDFSDPAEAAGRIARELALELGARLHIVHVTPQGADPGAAALDLAEAACHVETCRARIRGEALGRKVEAERAARRGAPA